MTTVIVKDAPFECFGKNVPDHVPLTSGAVCCAEPAAMVISNHDERNRTWNDKVLRAIMHLRWNKNF
jgi:hypothetical protein